MVSKVVSKSAPQPRSKRWTDSAIRALNLPDGVNEHRVAVERGLYLFLRRRADGTRSIQWQYRAQVAGKRRWLSIGNYPAVGLAAARAELLKQEVVLEAAKKGEADHPVIVARQTRRAARTQPTVAEAFKEWIEDKQLGSPRKGGAPVRERTIHNLVQPFKGDIHSRIGDARIATVTPQALRSCIDAVRARKAPGAAAMVYKVLRGLTRFAIKRGYITGIDPMIGIDNPKPYRPSEPNTANDAQIVALFQLLDTSKILESTRLAIEFQLLTGARPGEVRLATWPEIDLEAKSWTLPRERVKSDRKFRVHLSRQACVVLERAQALHLTAQQYVFPGVKKDSATDTMAVARALRRFEDRLTTLGGKRLRPHDLRKTFRTMLSRLGVLPHVAELCLNHLEAETMRRVYDGHDYSDETTAAWELIGEHLGRLRARAREASADLGEREVHGVERANTMSCASGGATDS